MMRLPSNGSRKTKANVILNVLPHIGLTGNRAKLSPNETKLSDRHRERAWLRLKLF